MEYPAGLVQPDPEPTFFEPTPTAPFGFNAEAGILNVQPADSFEGVSADVEGLLYLGYLTDDFEVFGHKFTIRTIRRGEKLAISQLVREWEMSMGFADAFQSASVAACIVVVDDRPLSMPLSIEEDNNPSVWIRRNFAIVNKWFDPVIEAVYEKFSNLQVRQAQAFLELQGK